MPLNLNPIRNFECEIDSYTPHDRVIMINEKLNNLYKSKSKGGNSSLTDYYMQERTRMKSEAYKCPIISHRGVYIPDNYY